MTLVDTIVRRSGLGDPAARRPGVLHRRHQSHGALHAAGRSNQPGTWTAGPDFPVITAGRVTGAKDAPAALLPNGRVLCLVAPCDQSAASNATPFWGSPVHFFEYDPATNTLTEVSAPTNSGGSPFSSRLILLPTGEVLHTNNSTTVTIYTPDGAPDPSWRPSITSVPTALLPGATYTLHGRQLNGLSQAVIYGDEGAMGTNYPIVRLTNTATGEVRLLPHPRPFDDGREHRHRVHTTQFTVPGGTALGSYTLCVIANGIESSNCQSVAVTHKRWKELKWEIKETKELAKLEHESSSSSSRTGASGVRVIGANDSARATGSKLSGRWWSAATRSRPT